MEFAQAGYNEALTLSLASYDDCFVKMRKEKDLSVAVSIANPQTPEFQMCHIPLLPGLLRTVFASIATPVPIKLFEVSDVVLKDAMQVCGGKACPGQACIWACLLARRI